MKADLRRFYTGRLDEMARLARELVEMESPTTVKFTVDRLVERVAEELAACGADMIIHPREEVGDIIEARWHTDQPGAPLLLLCHLDTVHPIGAAERNPVRLEDDRLYGPGSYDMKGGVATVLSAISGLHELGLFPERPIIALMTTDEETGSFYSRDLIQQVAEGAALAMVMEAALPDGSLKTWRKAVGRYTVRTYGSSAHAGGAHEHGVNAIEEMAHQIVRLQQMTDYSRGTTVNVGIINGGTRTNVIPDMCEAQVDVRAMTVAEMDRLHEQVMALRPVLDGARLEVSGGFDRPPMERNALMIETFQRAQQIAAGYGLTLKEAGTGGGSDGNYTAAIGTPTLDGLGPLGDGAHTDREFLYVPSMADSATLIAALMLEWPK